MNEAKTSNISVVHNTVLSYKPDFSSINHEVRSLMKTQDAKIDAQTAKIDTLTTLVNIQGTRREELKNLIKAIPTTPPTPSPSFTQTDLLSDWSQHAPKPFQHPDISDWST